MLKYSVGLIMGINFNVPINCLFMLLFNVLSKGEKMAKSKKKDVKKKDVKKKDIKKKDKKKKDKKKKSKK